MSPNETIFSHLRFSSLMMGIGAVLGGTACAALYGLTEVLPASLCIIFTAFAQMAGNMSYRYYDVTHPAGMDRNSRSVNENRKAPGVFLKEGAVVCSMIAIMCSLAIVTMGGWWTIIAGVFVVALGWLGMAGNPPLLRTPSGILLPFILFGPVCVICTSLLQVQHDNPAPLSWCQIVPALYMSIVIGLMCVNATMLYSYANFYHDRRVGKETFVAMIGRKATQTLFLVNGVVYTAVSVCMCIQLELPLNGLEMMPSVLCFILDIYIWWQMITRQRHQLQGLVDIGNFNVLLMGLLSFIIFELTGTPDLSQMTFFGI